MSDEKKTRTLVVGEAPYRSLLSPPVRGTEVKFWVVRYIHSGGDFTSLEDFATRDEAEARVVKMRQEGTEVAWSEPRFDVNVEYP